MSKKLPDLFKNKISKPLNNNDKVYYSNLVVNNSKQNIDQNDTYFNNNDSVNTKINKLLHATKYIFNIPVLITTKEKEYNTKILGKMGNVILIDNNKTIIPISDIVDIKTISN